MLLACPGLPNSDGQTRACCFGIIGRKESKQSLSDCVSEALPALWRALQGWWRTQKEFRRPRSIFNMDCQGDKQLKILPDYKDSGPVWESSVSVFFSLCFLTSRGWPEIYISFPGGVLDCYVWGTIAREPNFIWKTTWLVKGAGGRPGRFEPEKEWKRADQVEILPPFLFDVLEGWRRWKDWGNVPTDIWTHTLS